MRRYAPHLCFILLVAFVFSSCTGRTLRRETDEGTSMETTLVTSPHEAKLERGRQAAREGDFDLATEYFLTVYREAGVESKHREGALLQLAVVYSDLLNPKKDYGKALEYLEELLSTYPKSEYRKEAEERAEGLKTLIEEMK